MLDLDVLNSILNDHKKFPTKIQRIYQGIKEAHRKTVNAKTPAERFEILKTMVIISFQTSAFFSELTRHENLEELKIFPELKKLGYEREVHKLKEQHIHVGKIVESIRKSLEKYREGALNLEEMSHNLVKNIEEIIYILRKHIELENELFLKLLQQ